MSIDADPGQVHHDHLAVRNLSGFEVTFVLNAADGYLTDAGRFNTLPSDQESVDAGTWISLPDSVSVPAGSTVVVPFVISIPSSAEPGDHAAGVSASVRSTSGGAGSGVGVESRVGFRVTVRVSGEIAPSAAIKGIEMDYAMSWNPFAPGEISIRFTVSNTGNVRFNARGTVAAGGQSVLFPGPDEATHEFLPGDTRQITAVVQDVWPTFLVTTTTTLAPDVVTIDGKELTADPIIKESILWAMPWSQLIVLLAIALLIAAASWNRIRGRRRLAELLRNAREEGSRDAGTRGEKP
ncbi:MAG: hypothetical protein WAK00_05815 [Microbacterium sp.]|uniref:hypothetical protein n=1 Tax=Microbacterium sp. TaxID=51671 RepID=UPI003BB18B0B